MATTSKVQAQMDTYYFKIPRQAIMNLELPDGLGISLGWFTQLESEKFWLEVRKCKPNKYNAEWMLLPIMEDDEETHYFMSKCISGKYLSQILTRVGGENYQMIDAWGNVY